MHTATVRTRHLSSPPLAGRRERRRAEIRDRIYRAALQLFADRGFLETTVADITDAADVGKGTFFNYFPTKEHVLAAFGSERIAFIERAHEKAKSSSAPVLLALQELLTSLADDYSGNPALLRAIYAAHASCPEVRAELQKRLLRGRRLMAEMFDLARRRGEIGSNIPSEELARLTQVIFLGVTLSWAMNPDSSVRKTTEAVWNLVSPSFSANASDRNGKRRPRVGRRS